VSDQLRPEGYDEQRGKIGSSCELGARALQRLAALGGERPWQLRAGRWHLEGAACSKARVERADLDPTGAPFCTACMIEASGHIGPLRKRGREVVGACGRCEWSCTRAGKGATARVRFELASHALRELRVLCAPEASELRQQAVADGVIDAHRAQQVGRMVTGATVVVRIGASERTARVVDAGGVDLPLLVTYAARQRLGSGAGRQSQRQMSFDALGRRTGPLATWTVHAAAD
jgi:hypothetical protein